VKIAVIDHLGSKIGLEDYHFGYMNELAKLKHDIYYICPNRNDVGLKHSFVTQESFGNLWLSTNTFSRFTKLLSGYFSSFQFIRKNKIEVVHVHLYGNSNILLFLLIPLKLMCDCHIVGTIHDVASFKSTYIPRINLTNKFLDRFIFHNNYSLSCFQSMYPGESSFSIVPQGAYGPSPGSFSLTNLEPLEILFFGQIKKVKGLEVLLRAAELLKKQNRRIHLVIAGRPWDYTVENIEHLVRDHGLLDVTTLNLKFIEESKMDNLFSRAHVIALPYTEIFNSAVLKLAASKKRAVMVSDVPVFTEVIRNNINGMTFRMDDHVDLAAKLSALTKKDLERYSQKLYNEMQQKYSWGNIVNELVNAYQKA
jgi:glycosyltransferase involved in cell wall biosynthesis